jgi:ribosomal protein L7/L12
MSDVLAWIILIAVAGLAATVGALRGQLTRMEQKLNQALAKLGVMPNKDVPPEVIGLLQAGRKIEAIKVYRDATGAGLKEAKDAVEHIDANRIIIP